MAKQIQSIINLRKDVLVLAVIYIVIALILLPVYGENEKSDDPIEFRCGHISDHSTVIEIANINSNVSSALFLMNWSTPSNILRLVPIMPDGTRADKLPYIENVRGDGFEYYSIQDPEEGLWSLQIEASEALEIGKEYEYCLLIDLSANSQGNESSIAEKQSHFNLMFSDLGNDNNKNNLVESVTVRIGCSITGPDEYYVTGWLVDNSGKDAIFANNRSYLGSGVQFMMLDFSGLSTNGTRHLKNLTLYDASGKLLDHIDDAYATKIYDEIEYQVAQIAYLNGDNSDHGTDINSDSLFEFLTVDVGIDVLTPGEYTLTGALYDLKGNEIVWSVYQRNLSKGKHTMHLDFDGDTIEKHGADGPYQLKDLKLTGKNWTLSDIAPNVHNTSAYKHTDFLDPALLPQRISGSGVGELLLTVVIEETLPVFSGRYSQDLIGISFPPISSPWNYTGSKDGYEYNMEAIHIPKKPNDFNVTARGVKNLNIGLKKFSVPSQIESVAKYTRTWITSQFDAKDGTATASTDLISPGSYHVKIFGDADENISEVDLELTAVKKVIVNGRFELLINTTGLPSGNYSINAKALNGSFKFDELEILPV